MAHVSRSPAAADARTRIVLAAARLLRDGGREAVTTRAIESAAEVQAPTIYRLFGDKQGVIEAVAEHEMSAWVAAKAADAGTDAGRDPVAVLRDGWRAAVEFGLEHPALFSLMHGEPDPARPWAAQALGESILRQRVRRVAAAGLLALSEERAIALITASARGAVLTLLATAPDRRDLGMLDDLLDGLINTINTQAPAPRATTTAATANALRAAIYNSPPQLTPGEAALLDEILTRLAETPQR
ncbi:MAG: TetR/AcrR family transcriptional regulator [Actinomycetota bacterium]|nr:TetR/AcrR family transcriptional regulator [Actinomycetota bacterium]